MAASRLMEGKHGLVMGVANDRSIAWGVAAALREAGADLAISYQGDVFASRAQPLAETIGARLAVACDVEDRASLDRMFAELGRTFGRLDFVVHALAYADREGLKGRYLDTTPENFRRSLDISCFSFTEVARRAEPLMTSGGSLLTLSYLGAQRVVPAYNVMGVAKAALEMSVKYLAADLGPKAIRVNAISAGPVKTLAGSAIAGARQIYRASEVSSPLRRNPGLEEIGRAAMYLLSDLSRAVTGEIHYVDGGFHAVGMPGLGRD
ncbi:MAG: enoyl-ACP reductase [Rhodospirillales bacterium]|nr:enoyl-ACP reductase [Rhodospirillales bacterium]